MPMPIKILRSTILALTRQIRSQKPEKDAAILSRFSGPSPLLGMVTPGGEWWYTTQALLECENRLCCKNRVEGEERLASSR